MYREYSSFEVRNMTKKKEVKTPVPKPATLQAEEWQKSFNEQERELLELSITR